MARTRRVAWNVGSTTVHIENVFLKHCSHYSEKVSVDERKEIVEFPCVDFRLLSSDTKRKFKPEKL